MKAKYIFYLLPVALLIAANLYWGSVISWLLSIAIIASLLYYAARLAWEDRVNALLASFKKEDPRLPALQQVNEKWKAVMGFSLLAVVFGSAVFTTIKTTLPGGAHPWFLNNEYHSISHQGVAFDQALNIFPDKENTDSRIGISGKGQTATLRFQNVLKPVMAADAKSGKQRLLNQTFAAPVDEGFTISNKQNRLTVSIQPATAGFFRKISSDADRVQYTLDLQCHDAALLAQLNLAAPFKDRITLEAPVLKRGMSLFQLFLNNNSFHSSIAESYQILEAILLDMDDSYLLASYEQDRRLLYLSPGTGFFEQGYQLQVNGRNVAPQLSTTATLPYGQHFFIGFNNYRQQLYVDRIDGSNYGLGATEKTALLFDFPSHYLLKSPGEQPPGSKNIRFVTNDFDELTGGELTEGFYFQNYGLGFSEKVRGSMSYTSQKPGVPISVTVNDYLKGKSAKAVTGPDFSLSTTQPGISWLFHLRDFSDNGFSTHRTLLYLSLTFLAFVVLLVFFPGKKADRIEPVILAVIFVLLTLRYLLYWRLGTFPPLENISRYQLENTLLGFDFHMLGYSLPLPLSLVWTLLFVLFLIWYRRRPQGQVAFMPGPKGERFFQTPLALVKSYGIFIAACLFLFFLNKNILHIELLTRVISILIPVLGYCYFSVAANRYFIPRPMPLRSGEKGFVTEIKAYIYYLFHNPVFLLTLLTLLYFSLADRGFAILFALFILLKNIFVNFLKKPLDTSKTSFGRMLLKPNNYWIFGLLALVVYLAILAYKPLFYFLLQYKLLVILCAMAALLAILWIAFPAAKKWRLPLAALLGVYALLVLIPGTRQALNKTADNALKHVTYRASIIYQPLSEMLQEQPYSSFATRKIIETAENQWFINAYITKPYDPKATFNLRPYSKVGVDFPTQTRDVLTARFLVGELGDFTMYLILLLCILPLILYLMSYRLARAQDSEADKAATVASYAGLIPLILFFTLALFVWLTSTNRFVFFGQDFPFLSLTSRLSVLLPLLLFSFTLIQQPAPHLSTRISLRASAVKYVFFIGLIAFFALVTVKKNELNTENFNVVMTTTETHVNKDLNAVLDQIQDSLEAKNKRYTYQQLIHILSQSKAFDSLKNQQVQDPYTRSILANLTERPNMAFTLNNPLFMVYDNGRYQAVYNQNLYLQLPVIENREVWNGKILENITAGNGDRLPTPVFLKWKNAAQYVTPPYYAADDATGIQLGILPAGWVAGAAEPTGILSGSAANGRERFVYQHQSKIMAPAALRYARTLHYDDVALATSGRNENRISFQPQGRSFAFNKWVNGRYKIIYPLGAANFWLYHFATGMRANYSNDSSLVRNESISLDYELTQSVSQLLAANSQPLANQQRNYSFSVIAADGDGRIRLMQDVAGNRKILDPNDENKIYQLQQQHFFFSNARNERDQWGNRNLLHLYLGPGSAIKPLFSAVVTSGVNAGWEALQLNPAPAEVSNYAGLALRRPWKNVDHYGGIVDMTTYIEASSNFYQGLMMFLGSYTRQDFGQEQPSLAKVLRTAANAYPVLQWQGRRYYLPGYDSRKGHWPVTDATARRRTFFGNERSLIATGFESNAGLAATPGFQNQDQPNFVHSRLYQQWRQTNAGYLWAFPEASSFLQQNRDYAGIQENFNVGLKTAALGGYPYLLTPYKMLEMYLGLLSYNRDFHLRVNGNAGPAMPWQKDASWAGGAFENFLARQIFTGMARVISGGYGTAKRLNALKSQRPDLYFYAKTGTINEEASGVKSSRRLIVMASDKDLSQPENIGKARTFGWFFAVDNTGDFDWPMLIEIMEQTMQAASFKNYFQSSPAASNAPGQTAGTTL